jgi:transposase InsO family protein
VPSPFLYENLLPDTTFPRLRSSRRDLLVKHEDVYIKGYERVPELTAGLGNFFPFYNEQRPHQSLDYRTPAEVYRERRRAS